MFFCGRHAPEINQTSKMILSRFGKIALFKHCLVLLKFWLNCKFVENKLCDTILCPLMELLRPVLTNERFILTMNQSFASTENMTISYRDSIIRKVHVQFINLYRTNAEANSLQRRDNFVVLF